MKKINLNDIIRVKLTPKGKEILIKDKTFYKKDSEETFKSAKYLDIQIWEFMRCFGNFLFLGCDNVVENNVVFLKDTNCANNESEDMSDDIYFGDSIIIPLADVLFIEKQTYGGLVVVLEKTTWNIDTDTWNNNAYVNPVETEKFLSHWCKYCKNKIGTKR